MKTKLGEVVPLDLIQKRGQYLRPPSPLDALPIGELTVCEDVPRRIRSTAAAWNKKHRTSGLRIHVHVLKDGRVAVLKTRTEEGK